MADDLQRYSLRWNDFYANILSAFKTLKENEEFVDVTIACDGKSLTAHKVILSACSPFFRQVLKDNPCDHPIVILKDVRYQEMESLLNFMYHGEVQISQDDLTEFLRTAQSLQVKGLTDVPYQNHQPHHHNNNNNNNNNNATHHHHQSSNNNSNSQQATVERDRERGGVGNGGGGGGGGGGHIAEGRGGRCSTSPTHSSPCTTPPIMHIPEVRLDSEENHQTSDNSMGAVSAEKKLKLDLKNHEGSSPEVNNANKQPSQSSSILIQALEGTKRDDNNTSGAMEEESSPDESEMRYEEKGMDGIESSEELSAHALNDAIRFPAAAALLGFQGFLPGPSSLQNSSPSSDPNFDLLRVRATDPRPCPKCGKIYRSAHTLRTHLEDKHTICPGYRCVLCGTVAKSRNSLHSHMSRQHRGISTKDLPVLPMPAPFDPQLAAKLLAKAGLKFNAADAPGMGDKQPNKMDGGTTGSAILDTYLQFIAENSMGLAGQLYSNQQHKKNSAADIMEDNDSADEEDP